MNISTIKVDVVTDASGDFSVTTYQAVGKFLQMHYDPDGSAALDTGWGLTVVGAVTGQTLFNGTSLGTSAFTKAPRQPVHDNAGAASLYAAGGEPVEDYMFLNEKLTVTVASGGDSKLGTLWLMFGN